MINYLLFKQVVSIILFFETLVLWPKFSRYFGPLAFPRSFFTTPLRITVFNLFLLLNLICLFLNFYPFAASFFILVSMRYLYVTDSKKRISTAGAVGHICYLTSAYIFFFETAFIIDPSQYLSYFLKAVLAIEVGVVMIFAGLYKYLLGYFEGYGFEYALVNPSWSKLFIFFKKFPPKSWIFKINNVTACFGELISGILFFIPQTRTWGAYLLFVIFTYVFLTVRVAVLPLLMMSIALLYIHPIHIQFPTLEFHIPQIPAPDWILTTIKIFFVLYLATYICTAIYRALKIKLDFTLPDFLEKPMRLFMTYRPFFEWGVFTAGLTNFFVKIEKAPRQRREIRSTIYDGFSKNFREIIDDPKLFFRFIHHHESSFLLNIFMPLNIPEGEERQAYVDNFIKKMVMFAKTLLEESEMQDTLIVYTIMYIEKTDNGFAYSALYSYFVDVESGKVLETRVYKDPNSQ
jgi:hypothetical protein